MPDDDKKLPALRREGTRVDVGNRKRRTPVSNLIDAGISIFRTRALKRSNEELVEHNQNVELKGRLADNMTETSRKVARYVYDRDKLIEDDRQQTDHELALNKQRRDKELSEATREAARARTNLEGYEDVAPLIRKRGRDMFETGNYDALRELNKARRDYDGDEGRASDTSPATVNNILIGLEHAKATLVNQLEKATARGEDTTNLLAALGRLEADIQQAKNQPG